MLKQLLTITLLSATCATLAADLPKRRSGLWEISTTSSEKAKAGPGAITMSMCTDQNSDQNWLQMGQQAKCAKQDFKVERDRVVFSSVCNIGKTTVTSNGIASGDFNKEYKVEVNLTYDPPLGAMKQGSNTVVAKWLSPCKAGQKPGDMIMPNGMTMNMNDLMKMQK